MPGGDESCDNNTRLATHCSRCIVYSRGRWKSARGNRNLRTKVYRFGSRTAVSPPRASDRSAVFFRPSRTYFGYVSTRIEVLLGRPAAVFSVGASGVPEVRKYIAGQ